MSKSSFYDSLFGLNEVTVESAKEKGIPIQDISPDELKEFKGHPFKVKENKEFESLKESIRKFGILEPIIARKGKNGYEIISGHRRTTAAKSLGLKKVPVIITDLDDDLAKIMVVDANKYRKQFDPSEMAFAFKMRYEAEKHRGKSMGDGERTAESIGKDYGHSQRSVYNYMKLTQLLPVLLRFVDEKKLGCSTATELAELSEDMQQLILDEYFETGRLPGRNEAKQLREKSIFDRQWLKDIFEKEERPEKEKLSMSMIDRYFPEDYTDSEKMEVLEELLEAWSKERTGRTL